MKDNRKKILIIGGVIKSIVNFRGPLLKEMTSKGHKVFASANGRNKIIEKRLKKMGITYYPIHLSRTGMNMFNDLKSLLYIIKTISQIHPDIVLTYTIKPVIYGGLVARLCGVPSVYSMITGLGYAFMESPSLIQRFSGFIAQMLYRLSLKKSRKVFFQNPDDQTLFLEKGLVRPDQPVLINGSGVELDHFAPSELPDEPIFLMIGRLLADKGVREYVEAAGRVKKRFPHARFFLVGNLDPNPNSIRDSELRQWQEAGIIEYLGYLDDIRPTIKKCRCYILPSYYREGIPRTVLEAMAMGRPIITTDAPGCRETVMLTPKGQRQRELREGVMIGENGFLVKVRDVEALVKAIMHFLENPDLADRMAKRGRDIAEEKFDVHKVNEVIMTEMRLT
jgi:glycosyltransferase involved in cell wall biosynthesis